MLMELIKNFMDFAEYFSYKALIFVTIFGILLAVCLSLSKFIKERKILRRVTISHLEKLRIDLENEIEPDYRLLAFLRNQISFLRAKGRLPFSFLRKFKITEKELPNKRQSAEELEFEFEQNIEPPLNFFRYDIVIEKK